MNTKIAIFGGSFNPAAIHHRAIVEQLSKMFDQVIVVPCGGRPDKSLTNSIDPLHRAAMTDLTFNDLGAKVKVDLSDLEKAQFSRHWQLSEMHRTGFEVWLAVGSDMVTGGRDGESLIQKSWEKGWELWEKSRFVVFARKDYPIQEADLPPKSQVVQEIISGSSTVIREKIVNGESIEGLVVPKVVDYLGRHNPYEVNYYRETPTMVLDDPRPKIFIDEFNPLAQKLKKELAFPQYESPNMIIVLGGDGTMLQAIRHLWRARLPFFGVNLGHSGYLLNDPKDCHLPEALSQELVLRTSPLLLATVTPLEGQLFESLAFNDVWVQSLRLPNELAQAVWVEVKVNGQVRLAKLVGDGVLLATAAGSTAYARAMGGPPLPVGTPALVLVGNNVREPINWKSAILPLDSTVEFTNLNELKRALRPVVGFVDGRGIGEIASVEIRASRIAAADLVFLPNYDLTEKLAAIQFTA